MSYAATVVLDSLSPRASGSGERLTTLELTFPRFILAEFNTHRALSRNAASSRAIPFSKLSDRVMAGPFVPEEWGTNQRGMQAGEPLTGQDAEECDAIWLDVMRYAQLGAHRLAAKGAHKQLVNRLIEPWSWVTVIASATDWDNLFTQRCHKDAQPQFQRIAGMALRAYQRSRPTEMQVGQWHTPYVQPCEYVEFDLETRLKVSVARCARVSYLNHLGVRDVQSDLDLYDKLCAGMHFSPFEHVAQALEFSGPDWKHVTGNFWGWGQLRKTRPNENRSLSHEDRERLLRELEALGVDTSL